MRCLALDPAKRNTGWMVIEMDLNNLVLDRNSPVTWIKNKDKPYITTHAQMKKLGGGTITTTPKDTGITRYHKIANQIHNLVDAYKPEILSSEAAIEEGPSRNVDHLALLNLILHPYFKTSEQPHRRYLNGVNSQELVKIHIPSYVVLIAPIRLQSMAHEERSTSATEIRSRYIEATKDPKGLKTTEHERDAYFVAYHSFRFYLTAIKGLYRELDFLTIKEKDVMIENPNSMLKRHNQDWWSNI